MRGLYLIRLLIFLKVDFFDEMLLHILIIVSTGSVSREGGSRRTYRHSSLVVAPLLGSHLDHRRLHFTDDESRLFYFLILRNKDLLHSSFDLFDETIIAPRIHSFHLVRAYRGR